MESWSDEMTGESLESESDLKNQTRFFIDQSYFRLSHASIYEIFFCPIVWCFRQLINGKAGHNYNVMKLWKKLSRSFVLEVPVPNRAAH